MTLAVCILELRLLIPNLFIHLTFFSFYDLSAIFEGSSLVDSLLQVVHMSLDLLILSIHNLLPVMALHRYTVKIDRIIGDGLRVTVVAYAGER